MRPIQWLRRYQRKVNEERIVEQLLTPEEAIGVANLITQAAMNAAITGDVVCIHYMCAKNNVSSAFHPSVKIQRITSMIYVEAIEWNDAAPEVDRDEEQRRMIDMTKGFDLN